MILCIFVKRKLKTPMSEYPDYYTILPNQSPALMLFPLDFVRFRPIISLDFVKFRPIISLDFVKFRPIISLDNIIFLPLYPV